MITREIKPVKKWSKLRMNKTKSQSVKKVARIWCNMKNKITSQLRYIVFLWLSNWTFIRTKVQINRKSHKTLWQDERPKFKCSFETIVCAKVTQFNNSWTMTLNMNLECNSDEEWFITINKNRTNKWTKDDTQTPKKSRENYING